MNSPLITTLKRQPDTLLYAALFCSLFIAAFNFTLPLMASPYIVGGLGGSNNTASYTVTFFALGNALGIPLGRALLDKIGPLRFLVSSMLFFCLFSFLSAMAPNYPVFNAARFAQGFSCGPFYALVFHLFAVLVPQEKRSLFASINMSILTMTPVIAVCWGGWIAYDWNWRWIFSIDLPLSLFLSFYLLYRLKGFDLSSKKNSNASFDTIGYLSFCLGVFCLGFTVITGEQLDWLRSPLLITLTILGALFLTYFVIWELNHPNPILNLRLLKNSYFLFSILNLIVLFSAYFGMVILLALWLNLWINYTPKWIAILMSTMALSSLFPMSLVDEKIGNMDNRIFLALAIIFLAISCFHTMTFNIDVNFGRIAFSRILAGIGLALFLAPIFRIGFRNFPEESHLHVLTLFQVARATACSLGASVYTTIWQRRQVFYHDRLGSKLTILSPETQDFLSNAEQFNLQGEGAKAQLDYYLQQESASLALDDCFYLMGFILVGVLVTFIFTLILPRSGFISKGCN